MTVTFVCEWYMNEGALRPKPEQDYLSFLEGERSETEAGSSTSSDDRQPIAVRAGMRDGHTVSEMVPCVACGRVLYIDDRP